MSATTLQFEALVSTPAEFTECRECGSWNDDRTFFQPAIGVRYPGDEAGRYFAHCPECGTTDLIDVRSPWEILAEAKRNVAAPGIDVETRWNREDIASRIEALSADFPAADHCSDCRRFAPPAREVAMA